MTVENESWPSILECTVIFPFIHSLEFRGNSQVTAYRFAGCGRWRGSRLQVGKLQVTGYRAGVPVVKSRVKLQITDSRAQDWVREQSKLQITSSRPRAPAKVEKERKV